MASLVPGETLRVLLISPDEEQREAVAAALLGRAGDHRLFWVSQADLALGRARDTVPHVILVDDVLGSANPVTLVGQLLQQAPRTAVLALVGKDGMSTARSVVLAGARGFVLKPITADELVGAMRQVLAQQSGAAGEADTGAQYAGRIIVFCAPKGGTGRTTLATNTSIAIHQARKEPVVLVDADYAAPAVDVMLNLDPSRNILELLPKLTRLDADLVSSVLVNHRSGIRVLLAPPPADLTHPISLPQVQQVMAWLKRMFPWVVVDLGLPLDETSFAFLDGADRIVMTVLPEMVGLRNTRLMLDQLHERGYTEDKIWMVLNRNDLRGGVSVADIETRLKVSVRYKLPDDQALATHTVNRGVPVTVSHASSGMARAMVKFATELTRDLTGATEEDTTGGSGAGLGRLFGRR